MTYLKKDNAQSFGMKFALFAIFTFSVIAILYTFSSGISGNDFWWHVKVGEWIVNNGEIPTSDIFSWYSIEQDIPWTAHEWLSDVIFYFVFTLSGSIGIFILSLLSALIMLCLLYKQVGIKLKDNILISGLFFSLFAVSTSVFFYGRPHLFSFFLLFFELKILYLFYEDTSSKGIYFIPIISCVWSNIHGGSSNLSYILCIVFLIIGLLNTHIGCVYTQRMDKKGILKLTLVIVLSILAILINPFGVNMLLYPYQNMGDNLMLSVISEWRAPDAKNMGDLILFFFPVILMLFGFFAESKKIKMIDVAVMGIFVFLFLRSVRFIMLWYIAAVFCAFNYLPVCKVKPIKKKTEKILIIICAIVFVVSVGTSAFTVKKTNDKDQLISTVLSDEIIDEIKSSSPERLFNDYNLGETLIYNDIPVFFDARADVYAYENMLADGVSLMFLEQVNPDSDEKYADVEGIVEKYDFDSILILKSRPLYSYLMSHPEMYDCSFEDYEVSYFKVIAQQKG